MKFCALAAVALFLLASARFGPPLRAQATANSPAATAIAYVNSLRSMSGLPPVTEDATLDAAALAHSTYLLQNNTGGHDETPGNPGYTAAGYAAGQNSVVFGGSSTGPASYQPNTPNVAIDSWLDSVYHSVPLLNPMWTKTGFGFSMQQTGSDDNVTTTTTATMDVWTCSGAQSPPAAAITTLGVAAALSSVSCPPAPPAKYPVTFPANGSQSPYTTFTGPESPDPYQSCPGYAAPSGTPILLLLSAAPTVAATDFRQDGGGPLSVCVITGSASQNTNNYVVLLPRAPLTNGTYRVCVATNGAPVAWSFGVGGPPASPAPPPQCGQAAAGTGPAAPQATAAATPSAAGPTNPPGGTTAPPAATAPAPVGPAQTSVVSAANWSAALTNCFGATVTQSAAAFTGIYTTSPLSGAAVNGSLAGSVNGIVLSGTFSEPPNTGTFQITVSADGQSYTGQYTSGLSSGSCNGTFAGS